MKFINNKFIILIILLINFSILLPVASAGFENCIYCHGDLTFGGPYVNLTSFNNSMHGRINNTNDLNYACYACHWDGTPPKHHAKSRSQIKTCEYCHAGNIFQAPSVTEHILDGQDIKVNVDCIICHGNSVDNNAGYSQISDRVAHFGTTTSLMTPTIRSTNCTWCHYVNSGSSTWGTPNDPRTSGVALNHTPFSLSTQCYNCHVYGGGTPSTFHDSSLGLGGNRDCSGCHNTGGVAPKLVDFSATNDNKSVHRTLNVNAITSLNSNDLRCWACHGDGDGSENAQPAGGHPLNYKTPKNCNSNSCHSLSRSGYDEKMVYSHFQNSSLNNNPENATNYNITTSVQCQICHINSLVKTDSNSGLALASHYASKDNLIDSFNCTYCHLDKDNSEDWGYANLINKNTTSLIEIEKERNKLIVFEGESMYLGEGYSLKVVEISTKRNEALIQLFKNYNTVDEFSIGAGAQYKYEEEITVDNSTFKTPIIILNLTSIFKGINNSFIQFTGFRIKKVHTERESKISACFACHLYRYSSEKERYLVIDRESKKNRDEDIIYYTKVYIDFISENKSKIYFNNENYVFEQLQNNFGRYLASSSLQKYLTEGETWNIGENFSLIANEVSTDSKEVWLTLMINNSIVEDRVLVPGSEFNYAPGIKYKEFAETNVTVFSAKIVSVFQGKPNFVLLKDVLAISPWIMKTTANTTLFGYNSSWLEPNDTIVVGKIPENLHSPNMYIDQRMWPDCVRCHDTARKLNIPDLDAVSSRLGKHSSLNNNSSTKTLLSDQIVKACWACHTDGLEPGGHSPSYMAPRNCTSCHSSQGKPSYGAINLDDEPHRLEPNCEYCHILDSHDLKRFEVTPVIKEATLSQNMVFEGGTIKLVAKASAGYKMKTRAVEYFIDTIGDSGNGTPLKPINGMFDSQSKEVIAELNTSGISPGKHYIYIHAMERTNRWGGFYPLSFTIIPNPLEYAKRSMGSSMVLILSIGVIVAYVLILRRRS